MNKTFVIYVLAFLSIIASSCGGERHAQPADNDSTDNDTVIQVDETGPASSPNDHTNWVENAKREAEIISVEQSQDTSSQAHPKPAPIPSNDNVGKDSPVPSNDHGVSPTYKSELMNRLRQLDEQANQLMSHVDVVRDRLKITQEQGMQPNPDDQLDLSNTIDALIDIRNEQIALSKKLGNKQLEEDYISKAANLYDTKRRSLNR